MSHPWNLKYHSPVILLVLFFATAVFFSFKRTPAPEAAPKEVGETTVTPDQIQIGEDWQKSIPIPGSESEKTQTEKTQSQETLPQDQKKLETLNQIIEAKNDNDPRLDSELKNLSPAAKNLFKSRYQSLKAEQRNAKSTVVFLIGREIQDLNDLNFMHQVLTETPCLSLKNCKARTPVAADVHEDHFEGMDETTLALPQIHALKGLQRIALDPSQPKDLFERARAEIRAAKASPIQKVSRLAHQIEQNWIQQ